MRSLILACALLVAGCAGSPVSNLLAGAPATTAEPATVSPSPAATPLWKPVYEDFAFKFSYPRGWTAKDIPLDLLSATIGRSITPYNTSRAAAIVDESGKAGIMLYTGPTGSVGEPIPGQQSGPAAVTDIETRNYAGTDWKRMFAQTFKDGVPQNGAMYSTVRNGTVYILFVAASDGRSIDMVSLIGNDALYSWEWKN